MTHYLVELVSVRQVHSKRVCFRGTQTQKVGTTALLQLNKAFKTYSTLATLLSTSAAGSYFSCLDTNRTNTVSHFNFVAFFATDTVGLHN